LASQQTACTHPQYVGVSGPLLLLLTSQYVVLLAVPVPVVETAVELSVMGHTAHTGLVVGAARASEAEKRSARVVRMVSVRGVCEREGCVCERGVRMERRRRDGGCWLADERRLCTHPQTGFRYRKRAQIQAKTSRRQCATQPSGVGGSERENMQPRARCRAQPR
jgi:hypothetical protein